MSTLKIGRSHKARKALFTRGIRRGFLSVEEIDEALPPGSLTDAERWLLYYSLKASRVEIRDGEGNAIEVEERPPAERSAEEEIGEEIGFEAEADTQH
jgi:Sigma-70 factor, region 1.1